MQDLTGLPENEVQRRLKISKKMKKVFAERRKQGLKRYWRRRRKELAEKKKEEEKEKARLKKEQEKEKLKNKPRKPRKKKRGPKINKYKRRKKKLEKERRAHLVKAPKPPFIYQIMLCSNGKRYYTIGKYRTSEEAYAEFKNQKWISDSVVFPRNMRVGEDEFKTSVDECILIQKTDSGPTNLRNEYGKLVEHHTDLEGWEIIDKFKNNVEETFWVFGYDNRSDRKTFMWIYENLIVCGGFEPYEFRRVFTYLNKLLIRYDDNSLEMVICKSEFDAVTMYNKIQEMAKKDGIKQLVFIGDRSALTPERKKLEKELMELTGWTVKKLSMKNTTYRTKVF